MNVVIVTQMRMGSTRLPGKVLKMIGDKTLMQIHLERLSKSITTNKIIIATTTNTEDDAIELLGKKLGFEVYRGSVNDVLERYYFAIKELKPQLVVRVTGDCPLLDHAIIDAVVMMVKTKINQVDYCSNTLEEHFPDGQDVEVVTFQALEKAFFEATLKSDREHVTPYIRRNSDTKGGALFKSMNFPCVANYSHVRMTLDEQADFDLISKLINNLGTNKTWKEYTEFILQNKLSALNEGIIRNEGYLKSIKSDTNHA